MGNYHYFLLILVYLLKPTYQSVRYGFPPEVLHVNMEDEKQLVRHKIIDINLKLNKITTDSIEENLSNLIRNKRDDTLIEDLAPQLTTSISSNTEFVLNSNISVQSNNLNDSHAQLMVHWLGEGTDVMICLAREPPPLPIDDIKTTPSPSSVFISYDYGNKFEEKTHEFQVIINGTEMASTLDQFMTHPKFNTIVFTDPRNKAIFTSNDNGKTIKRYMLNFKPSDVSFYELDAKTFLVLDKDDPERKLYFTTNFGETFDVLQSYVKSFVWSSGDGMPIHLYVERKEPTNTSSVIFMNASHLLNNGPKKFNFLIENVQDFHIKKDFMFATRKQLNNTQLLISWKRNSFIKADFQTELDIKGIHIADVEGKRIFVSAVHSEVVTHLYVSETDNNMTDIKFITSIENVFSYIPELTWKSSWLVQTSDEAFTDLYKVEGLRGIYIASKLIRQSLIVTKNTNIGPEHLVSVISFDHGATWSPITAPTVDDEGQLINCTKDCSLHLSQKFSQLYPVTRSVTIMSSKSAPGVIMASGVIGRSLKGHPGVFISRDAGLTWKQILKNYHFFNFGDHGGILVAVKYFKSKGETHEILYSTDEGEKWISHPFHSKKLKVYGLMTEPNTNTTIFTLFGSEPDEHRWLIVKIDLKNAFDHNCTTDDYKFWAPGSQTGQSLAPCLMGVQNTYQRRIPHSNCYNGIDYDRPIKSVVCQCNSWDFECDYGFTRINNKSPCIRNKTLSIDVYKIPSNCKAGDFYNRTKGYRKIEGDMCFDGFSSQYLPQQIPCPIKEVGEFLIVAQRDKISRIDLSGTGEKKVLPVTGLRNVIAIDYDLKNNCVFWADIMSDVIARQCFNGETGVEILVDTDLASVEGMSYDWISKLLFFVDGTRIKIEAVSTSNTGRGHLRTTIIDSKNLSKPRGIVVHPIEGYLYWTDWSTTKPSLSRSNLDGTDIQVLFTKPQVIWPNGVTIDYIAERVYWVDASKDYIASCDLHGQGFKKIIEQDSRVAHPFAVAVYKDLMYWDDWKMNSVFSADKDQGIMTHVVADDMTSLMDLKIFAHSIQHGENDCSTGDKCSLICVGTPKHKHTCLCPEGMKIGGEQGQCLCPGGVEMFSYANKTCPQLENTCAPSYFTCANKRCIPLLYRCDNENDCGDDSDEVNCSPMKPPCPPHTFTCKSDHKCIPEYFHCDHDKDCIDGSDEIGCTFNQCNLTQFACKNGRCISMIWMCDGEDDCRDGSDEVSCTNDKHKVGTCKSDEFKCASSGTCIPEQWRCDSDHDCPDASDENNCKTNHTCDSWMFACGDGHCIYNTWVCDGDQDCTNGADEKNCTTTIQPQRRPGINLLPSGTCHDWMFKCTNNNCIPDWWKCDGVNDCGDFSDEFGCSNTSVTPYYPIIQVTTTTSTTPEPTTTKCEPIQYRCRSGMCISKRNVCDRLFDCPDGDDEDNCPFYKNNCGIGKFRCRSDGLCLPREKYCDKFINCVDGSDEEDCEKHPNNKPDAPALCNPGMFSCDNICMALTKLCDGRSDCYDGTDEKNCNTTSRVYQVTHIGADERTLNATSFLIFWWFPIPQNMAFEFLPSITIGGTNNWINHTNWVDGTEHRFLNLRPYTNYNVTVYVRIKNGNGAVFIPYLYFNTTTGEGIPSEPLNVKVIQVNGSRVQVNWDKPKEIYGILAAYTVYYSPQSITVGKSQSIKVSGQEQTVTLEYDFKDNVTYTFYVRAKNTKHESAPSILVRLTFDDTSNIDAVHSLKIQSQNETSITLTWNPISTADGYIIQPLLPQTYPKVESIKTTDSKITLSNLIPGTQYLIKVSAFVKNYYGRPATLVVTQSGEPLPVVPIVRLYHDLNILRLHWNEPKMTIGNGKIIYGVYYGTSMDELFEKPRLITEKLEATFSDLIPCESYLFAVGIVGPIGPGQLGRSPQTVTTPYSGSKPPKSLSAVIDSKKNTMLIKWEQHCPFSGPALVFVITVTELTFNKTSRIQLTPSMNKTMVHEFKEIPLGAKYNISVGTNLPNAQTANITCQTELIPTPTNLLIWPEKNGSFIVYWKEIDNIEMKNLSFNFTYQLVVLPGQKLDTSLVPIITIESHKPPIILNPDVLGGNDAVGKIFTAGVRLKTDQGFVSEILEGEHIGVQQDALISTISSTSTSIWVYILPIAVVFGLVAVIIYLIQRQKRLQTSFSRFANTHYDTKTGATRIGTDDDDHQDAPRFADDEPLVIA